MLHLPKCYKPALSHPLLLLPSSICPSLFLLHLHILPPASPPQRSPNKDQHRRYEHRRQPRRKHSQREPPFPHAQSAQDLTGDDRTDESADGESEVEDGECVCCCYRGVGGGDEGEVDCRGGYEAGDGEAWFVTTFAVRPKTSEVDDGKGRTDERKEKYEQRQRSANDEERVDGD